MDIAAIMDALADATAMVVKRTYPYPVDTVSPPCIVIGYPTDLTFDTTMGRGSDSAIFPVFYVAGKANDRNTRDDISSVIKNGAIKDAIDDMEDAVNSAYVSKVSITEITINGVSYIAAQFDTEIIS
jgi:hypothetical protein